MKIKICGIKDVSTALAIVEYGADAIGLVFADSKRKIDMESAIEIVKELPDFVMKVGVFVNETKEEMERIASCIGLTHLQLHGDETPEFCQTFAMPIIKALSIKHKNDLEKIKQYPCESILLDGPKGRYRGGNGEAFDWNLLQSEDLQSKQFILAGGLHEENVQEAIQRINPYMVDVSSGVETEGKKDLNKIKSFIEKVKITALEEK
ncbi:phosphoribosylanthranilate isomerase [Neobacillus sp. PS3-40]|uniref:phosphoribosylanthranilate isomerase n=1 Tax=Neobacillus sp. PS3-40 TaxID=3070679 RepID=UPI0027DF18B5|nr:phosphoribosylanthranilate isomerase [Neobacillus sp. PS3-40]WML44956.1 phosphoribosylanthranilate isomerase [Neobacillus sp. PS3-40]